MEEEPTEIGVWPILSRVMGNNQIAALGILDCGHAGLHRTRGVHDARLQQRVRLVVTWGDHVRESCWLSAILCQERKRHVQKKIINWPRYLHSPEEVHLSTEAHDLGVRTVP